MDSLLVSARSREQQRLTLRKNANQRTTRWRLRAKIANESSLGADLHMPLLSAVGFAAIGFAPILTVLATFQILRRAAGFALLRPAREVLFTVLRRGDKYKAKSLIDTFGYRLGDQIGAWSYPLMRWLGLGLAGIS